MSMELVCVVLAALAAVFAALLTTVVVKGMEYTSRLQVELLACLHERRSPQAETTPEEVRGLPFEPPVIPPGLDSRSEAYRRQPAVASPDTYVVDMLGKIKEEDEASEVDTLESQNA